MICRQLAHLDFNLRTPCRAPRIKKNFDVAPKRGNIAVACIVPRGAAQLGGPGPAGDDAPVPAKGKTDSAMVLRALRSGLRRMLAMKPGWQRVRCHGGSQLTI